MSYVEKMISRREKLVCMTSLHWIYMVYASLYLLFFLVLAHMVHSSMMETPNLTPLLDKIIYGVFRVQIPMLSFSIAWLIAAPGVAIFIVRAFDYIGSEVCVTTKKLIYKKGLIWITVDDIDIDEIQSETVFQGLLGPVFDYGRLVVDSRFVKDLRIPPIVGPYTFLKRLHEIQDITESKPVIE